MAERLRLLYDRRSGLDRRTIYNLVYSHVEGTERRSGKERRSGNERRKNWFRVTKWSSVLRLQPQDME